MIKILFICHGNICRSVAAEMVLRQMLEAEAPAVRAAADSAAALRQMLPWQINKILITGTRCLLMPRFAQFPADEDLITASSRSFVRAEFNRKEAISPVESRDH